eukprot:2467963-Pleurochrysis_carterae.AAC.2
MAWYMSASSVSSSSGGNDVAALESLLRSNVALQGSILNLSDAQSSFLEGLGDLIPSEPSLEGCNNDGSHDSASSQSYNSRAASDVDAEVDICTSVADPAAQLDQTAAFEVALSVAPAVDAKDKR